ncbi:bis(5'-adenosyl)-triphosphatase isoform X2 [Zonotrichia leucophrys gambelii]|uniref:bis(5'-adenosyl)-triphosphatase isoform X2 n=1 Tax=Zonotrichia leucophrys gambelii TaxID=257770 RepID=UPI00313FE1D6
MLRPLDLHAEIEAKADRTTSLATWLHYQKKRTLKISPDHAEIWAAPDQALGGVPEDRAELCSGEPQAGAARTYPCHAAAPWEGQDTLRTLGRPVFCLCQEKATFCRNYHLAKYILSKELPAGTHLLA